MRATPRITFSEAELHPVHRAGKTTEEEDRLKLVVHMGEINLIDLEGRLAGHCRPLPLTRNDVVYTVGSGVNARLLHFLFLRMMVKTVMNHDE